MFEKIHVQRKTAFDFREEQIALAKKFKLLTEAANE